MVIVTSTTGASSDDNWYLVQVKANSLRIADRSLRRQGFQVFCPVVNSGRAKDGRSMTAAKPLFPGYLFVKVDPSGGPWRAINNTPGVSRLVAFGTNHPKPVPPLLIAELVLRCPSSSEQPQADRLQPGDVIQVNAGPFSNLVSTIDSVEPDKRVIMLLEILGRTTRIGISSCDVVKIRSGCGN